MWRWNCGEISFVYISNEYKPFESVSIPNERIESGLLKGPLNFICLCFQKKTCVTTEDLWACLRNNI